MSRNAGGSSRQEEVLMAEVQSAHGTLRPQQSGYADVNGVHMYHEIYGGGSPLVLLHGGMLTIELNFAQLIPILAGKHQVIGVELQGHGRTADIDRAITPAALASDVVGLLDHLGIDTAHVFGHSMGGATAMELAINRPDRVRAVVAASVSVRPDGLHEDLTDPDKQATSPRMPTQQDFIDFQQAYACLHTPSTLMSFWRPCRRPTPTRGDGLMSSSPRSPHRSCWCWATATSPPSSTAR